MPQTQSVALRILRREYGRIFEENWSPLTGGVMIGLMSIVTFAWARPWGVGGGIRNWGDWLFYGLGLYEVSPKSALTSYNSVLAVGLLWGALAAALMARQFAIRVPPRWELFKGAGGGVFLGMGAALAGGCNVGGFYSSIAAFSLSGFAMMLGLLFGAYVGLKYLYWEMEHLSPTGAAGRHSPPPESGAWKHQQPLLGAALVLGALCAKEIYALHGHVISGGLLMCGIAFGFIMHRSRFCFARCFREPFMTGEAASTQAVIVSLLICALGFGIIKWTGVRSEHAFTSPSFGLGGLAGGVLFGFGMLLAGGCGSGTIWRAAEGQVKLVAALATFAVSTSLTKTAIRSAEGVRSIVGQRVFLPDVVGYPLAMLCVFMMMAVWYFAVTWNKESEFFVVQM